ncbi:MAG: DUF4156 domain-containing protein, partial [Gammaproteobacteria bacterium]|nr:DUF4156 domain-containing protein [Gammaproteobacteria bacterium]
MKKALPIIAASLAISACSGIKLTDEGEKIRVLDPGEVQSCRELGKTNTAVTARIIVDRPIETVSEELRVIARNSAARMGGDTIVPLTVIENGSQTFVVYKCINP